VSENPPNSSDTFSITVLDAKEINKECSTQLDILEDLIREEPDLVHINKNTFYLLCESYQTSYKVASISSRLLEENERFGEPDKEEILINGTDMLVLQTAMMARHYIGLDLVKTSGISTAIH